MRRAAIIAAVVFAVQSARAQGDEDNEKQLSLPESVAELGQPVETATKKTIEVQGGGLGTTGNGQRMRELLRIPDAGWVGMRVFIPIDRPLLLGTLSLELTSMATGSVRFRGRFRDGSKVRFEFRRDLLPYAFRARSATSPLPADAQVLNNLEISHDQLHFSWERPVGPYGGVVDTHADFDRQAGPRPVLAAGFVSQSPIDYAFGNPGYRNSVDWWIGLHAGYTVIPRGVVRLRLELGYRYDDLKDQLSTGDRFNDQRTGSLSFLNTEHRNSVDIAISAESAKPGPLLVGGIYRMYWTRGEPHTQQLLNSTGGANGTIVSEDIDLSTVRHRGVVGLAWNPTRKLRVGLRLEGFRNVLSGSLLERRELATSLVDRASSSFNPLGTQGQLDMRYAPLLWLAFEEEGRISYLRGEDAWSQTLLLADRTTNVGLRELSLIRNKIVARVELRAVVTAIPKTKVILGGRADVYRQNEDDVQMVDAFRLGHLDHDRGTFFASMRTRISQRIRIDASGSYFFEQTRVDAAKPIHEGFDVRLRASGVVRQFTFFLLGVLTDDQYELSPRAQAGLSPGAAATEFHGRSWLGTAGVTITFLKKGLVSAIYSHVANTADLATQMQNAALDVSWALPWQMRFTATGRYLRFENDVAPWENGQALLAFTSVAGRF